ncbi:MAG: hypothetical protein A3J58_03425 [Candidatus Sungbacteria bacterium RIFCSPHIGHO2_02_FULL_52_23]|uniref:SHSP domain-containing protein n=1 Tax=Candidatus Sungbacteria bacterium RIFCSPHIGHO2_02_FULL_52_23 TaxID=1802274 RepID=A0A1G2KXU4_9BACT|nr:MAG: hypothetical protein A3J58_03425 [Candidatus Sungbacteria bacterium RIFCSPHIGHO2_02_FULL_52_23]
MSTFFEKLTGARPRPEDDDRASASMRREPPHKEPPSPHARHEGESRPTHLKVESEERPARRPEPAPEPVEEEGELTVDIYDKGDAIVIQSTVAGVKPEDLDVSITSDSVTIRGKREAHEEVKEENYYYKELFWGTFSRSVILPEEIEDDMAEASLKHGLLTIRLPKKRRGVVQKLKVKSV